MHIYNDKPLCGLEKSFPDSNHNGSLKMLSSVQSANLITAMTVTSECVTNEFTCTTQAQKKGA